MSSKLKRKSKEAKFRPPYSNMAAQHFGRELAATRQQLQELEKKNFEDGFEAGFRDAQNWSNACNGICFILALNRLYGFGHDRLNKVFSAANQYMRDYNDGKETMTAMCERAEKVSRMKMDDRYKELFKIYGP